ncbi:MAG TPA: HEAT repeat domain-containing protein, partial [Thermoanaerobaculia bacterium]
GHQLVCSYDDVSQTIGTSTDRANSSRLFVLYDVSGGHVRTIRLSSPECPPSTQTIQWLENVDVRESARFLRSIIDGGDRSVAKKAVNALALHPGTVDDLIDIARHNATPKVRGMALFWVSQAAGQRAASVLKDAVDHDPEAEVKTKAVFGISQLPDDQSIPMLIDLIKTNRSPEVRKKAAFWLGQKDDPRALAALEDILKQ